MYAIIIILSILLNTTDGYTVIRVPGDINIGILMNLRGPPDPDDPSRGCGKIEEINGIQELEAVFWSLHLINNDRKFLPDVVLGIEICDTCWLESLALHQSLYLIGSASIMRAAGYATKLDELQCERAFQRNLIFDQFQKSSVVGVIGTGSSQQTAQVKNLFNLFKIPQFGFFYPEPHFHDTGISSTIMRIFPCSTCQAKVVRDILQNFNWTYVATIHTIGDLGEATTRCFRNVINPNDNGSGICIAKDLAIQPNSIDLQVDAVIREIDADKSVNVVVCFCEKEAIRRVFEATKRLKLTNRFTFIVSDGWGSHRLVVDGLEEEAWGTISVRINASPVSAFSEYYKSLKPSNNVRNPWFEEFWEDKFNCTLPKNQTVMHSNKYPRSGISASRKLCNGNETLADGYIQHRSIGYIIKMIWAMAHGLHNMIISVCGNETIIECDVDYPINTTLLLVHLRNLSFQYEDELVTINDKDSASRYVILNYQKTPDNNFDFIKIGEWANETLKLSKTWQGGAKKPQTSVCSLPCSLGSHKVFGSTDKNQNCCWECVPCGNYEYVSLDKERCIECSEGERPNLNRTGCDKVPILGRDWTEPTTIMIVIFTITGVIGTLYTFYMFIKYRNTPVVKASCGELCYLILFSMILCHASVFINLAEPTPTLCALSCTLPAVSLTAMHAALFAKTNRIARMLAHSKEKFPKKKRRLMSTSSQVAITFFCVAIEIAVCFAALSADPSSSLLIDSSRDRIIISCKSTSMDAVPAIVIVVLLGLCIIDAIKTRNVPGNFNEAKFMGFSMLFSLITWIFFFTLYFGTPSKVPTLCMCLTLDTFFKLIFLFFPKLYIIIFKPEKNNGALFMTNKNVRTDIGSHNSRPSLDYPIKSPTVNNFGIREISSGLRRSVAVQTSSKLIANTSSSPDENQSFSDDDNDDNFSANTLSGPDRDSVATVDNNQEKKIHSMKRIRRWRDKFSQTIVVRSFRGSANSNRYEIGTNLHDHSAVLTPTSYVELNVNNLLNR